MRQTKTYGQLQKITFHIGLRDLLDLLNAAGHIPDDFVFVKADDDVDVSVTYERFTEAGGESA